MENWKQKPLEPGMLCMLVGCQNPENMGKVVTLVRRMTEKTVGHVAVFCNECVSYTMNIDNLEWWETDTPTVKIDAKRNYKYATPYSPAHQLMPIDGHEPDAQDQAIEQESTRRRPVGEPQ